MADTKKETKMVTISEEEHGTLVEERDGYKEAYENQTRNSQAIIEEKNIIISVLIDKLKTLLKS